MPITIEVTIETGIGGYRPKHCPHFITSGRKRIKLSEASRHMSISNLLKLKIFVDAPPAPDKYVPLMCQFVMLHVVTVLSVIELPPSHWENAYKMFCSEYFASVWSLFTYA